ncbi:DoxX family protein [Pseudarthrobacter sp. TAF60_1]|uniref:DoxX family protein n=1 Tax=Pseudarthrobacter sp. TAF60_1 TaxID=3233071 RepID=UPI003F9DFE08
MPFRWSRRGVQTISAGAMSALLLTSAMKHFREPRFFAQVVPDYLCRDAPDTHREAPAAGADSARGVKKTHDGGARPLAVMTREEWIAVSGLLEAGAAVVLLIPATRRVAATALAGMFSVFLAGHVDALRRAYGPMGSPGQRRAHTVRLPLQFPLILWAWSLRGAAAGPRR